MGESERGDVFDGAQHGLLIGLAAAKSLNEAPHLQLTDSTLDFFATGRQQQGNRVGHQFGKYAARADQLTLAQFVTVRPTSR